MRRYLYNILDRDMEEEEEGHGIAAYKYKAAGAMVHYWREDLEAARGFLEAQEAALGPCRQP